MVERLADDAGQNGYKPGVSAISREHPVNKKSQEYRKYQDWEGGSMTVRVVVFLVYYPGHAI